MQPKRVDSFQGEPRRTCRPGGCSAPRRRGFTILELEISLGVLMAGLLGMVSLLSMYGRQLSRTETWCRSGPTLYVRSQPDRWMRKFEAAAEVNSEAGQEPWSPPVTGTRVFDAHLTSCSMDSNAQLIVITVELGAAGE